MSLEMFEGYTPADFGLDARVYESFRTDPISQQEVQLECIEFAVYCEKRIAALCAPTGLGKRIIAWCVHQFTGLRTVILTGTKGLQDDYSNELGRYGLVDIRGRSNFQCADFTNLDCRGGATVGCRYILGGGCEYERRKFEARNKGAVVANYAYWLNVNDKAGGLERTAKEAELFGENPVELLILDEAHEAHEWLSDYLAVSIFESEVKRYIDQHITMPNDDIKLWQRIIKDYNSIAVLEAQIRTLGMELNMQGGHNLTKHDIDRLHDMERFVAKLKRIETIQDDWVCEAEIGTRWGRTWKFDVVWVGRYVEQYLLCGVPKVMMMSATLNRKTMGLLGQSQEKYEFREWKRIYPIAKCPIYYFPVYHGTDEKTGKAKALKITRNSKDHELKLWVEHMDDMIGQRLDRRIVLLTTSYRYQEFIMENSRYAKYMIGNKNDPNSPTAMEKFEEFVNTEPPVILCSPSFGTGWDFAFDKCEFFIISKVPLKVPGGASKVMAARLERDDEYGANETMIDIVQNCGRPQRDDKDRGEVVIADGSWGWFGYRNEHLAPTGFVKSVQRIVKLPKAPEKLPKRRSGKERL